MVERQALCDTLVESADAPTLCGDWTTRDLAAHLVVRDRRPDAAPGLITSFMTGYTEQVRATEAEPPLPGDRRPRSQGPPHWSPLRIDVLDRLANSLEFFVHHEDIRRARRPFTPRSSSLISRMRWPRGSTEAVASSPSPGRRLGLEPDGRNVDLSGEGPRSGDGGWADQRVRLFVYGRRTSRR